jgi:hypothetical protein
MVYAKLNSKAVFQALRRFNVLLPSEFNTFIDSLLPIARNESPVIPEPGPCPSLSWRGVAFWDRGPTLKGASRNMGLNSDDFINEMGSPLGDLKSWRWR